MINYQFFSYGFLPFTFLASSLQFLFHQQSVHIVHRPSDRSHHQLQLQIFLYSFQGNRWIRIILETMVCLDKYVVKIFFHFIHLFSSFFIAFWTNSLKLELSPLSIFSKILDMSSSSNETVFETINLITPEFVI